MDQNPGRGMNRWLLGFALLAGHLSLGRAQEAGKPSNNLPAAIENTDQPPAAEVDPEAVPLQANAYFVPGDGLTVSMLNDTSRLKLFGQFSGLGIFSTDRPFSAGLPLLLLPPSPFGLNTNTFDLHARQSALGASFSGPEVLGLTPGGFFLGFIQNDSLTNDAYGLLPFQGYGDLKNDRWRIAAGLQSDVFNPGKPTIISLGSLFGSGNTGSFRGQARLEHFLEVNQDLRLTAQVALSEPISTIVTSAERINEDNGWPNIEARLAADFGEDVELVNGQTQKRLTIGSSGVIGQMRSTRSLLSPTDLEDPTRAIINTWGFGLDAQWTMNGRFGLEGEFYIGQGLGEYNGGILQSFNPKSYQSIRAGGGWGEAYCYLTDKFHVHVGYGIDAPVIRDLAPTQFAKNQTLYTNLVWNPSKVLQVSFEVDFRRTDYIAFRDASGVIFLTEMLWKF